MATNGEIRVSRAAMIAARRSIDAARVSVAKGFAAAVALRRAALELVFPGSCICCQTEIDGEQTGSIAARLPICSTCFDEFDLLKEPMCQRCGGPLPNFGGAPIEAPSAPARQGGCFRCGGRKLWFDETIAAGLYDGRLREMLLSMKSAAGDPISLAMGQLVWQLRKDRLAALRADVVVPIPLHWRRRLAHRTNSAAVLAEVLADRLRVPLADGLLKRRRHTLPQSGLTPPQRWENVRQAFSVAGGYHLSKAKVLVVDDILTTGATCSEAARALRKAGAERVTIVVVARAIG